MRLLIDANIGRRLVAYLRKLGHDVVAMIEDDPNANDDVILARAVSEQRTLITYDKDFGQLVFEEESPHWGVILLRTRDESFAIQQQVIDEFLREHSEVEIKAHFWVLTDRGTRRAHRT